MNVEEFKLKINKIKFWVLILHKDIWIWIGVVLDCGQFYKGLNKRLL
jgi:hypothetical protein